MSTNLTKLPTEPIRETRTSSGGVRNERRRRTRVRVHWPVHFLGGSLTEVVTSITRDLSSEGFSCFSRVAFLPDETLGCHIRLPEYHRNGVEHVRVLDCRVRVVWVEPVDGEAGFRIGCRLEAYRLISSGERAALSDTQLLRQTSS